MNLSDVQLEDFYQALVRSPQVRSLRRLQYRCERRCQLLDAIETPQGIILHQIRFKQSHEVNQQRSNAAGRRANTVDGANHWKPRTYFIEVSALGIRQDPGPRLAIQCEHVGVTGDGGEVALLATEFWDDWEAGHAEVRVRRDSSRYAV